MKREKKYIILCGLFWILILFVSLDYNQGSKNEIFVSNEELDLLAASDTVVIRACSGESTATGSEIKNPKTAWIGNKLTTGTMPLHSDKTIQLNAGDSYTVLEGYHDGKGTIVVRSLKDQTSGDAIAKNILIGTTVWVNGEKITGTMPKHTPKDIVINPGESYQIPEGYYPNDSRIITTPLSELTPGDAIADYLSEGKVAWVNGQRVVGNGKKNQEKYQEGYAQTSKTGRTYLTNINTSMAIKIGGSSNMQGTEGTINLDTTGSSGSGYLRMHQTGHFDAQSYYQSLTATTSNRKCQ